MEEIDSKYYSRILKTELDRIFHLLRQNMVVDGEAHLAEPVLDSLFEAYSADDIVRRIISLASVVEEFEMSGLLRLLSRKQMGSRLQIKIVRWGLTKGVQTRDAAMQCADSWSKNQAVIQVLEEHQETVPNLIEYRNSILTQKIITNTGIFFGPINSYEGLKDLIKYEKDEEASRKLAFLHYFFISVSPTLPPKEYLKIYNDFSDRYGAPFKGPKKDEKDEDSEHTSLRNFSSRFLVALKTKDTEELLLLCHKMSSRYISVKCTSKRTSLAENPIFELVDLNTENERLVIYTSEITQDQVKEAYASMKRVYELASDLKT